MLNKLEISRDTFLVIAHVRVAGVETHTEKVRDERQGTARETERNTTRTIAHEHQFDAAKLIESRIRGAVAKLSTDSLLGRLTDSKRLALMRDEVSKLKREVDTHNTVAPLHSIAFDFIALPIGMTLDEEAQRGLCNEVAESLREVKGYVFAGDVKRAKLWLNRRKNLSALMPAIVGQVVDDAITEIKQQVTRLASVEREGGNPADVGPSLALDTVDAAINWATAPIAESSGAGAH